MKLLLVTHFFESHRGGIEIVAGQMARELAAIGHAVRWAAADTDPTPKRPGVEPLPLRVANFVERIIGLPMPIPLPSAIRRLWRAARSADAVILHDGLYATSVIALLAAKAARRPVILVQHIAPIPFSSRLLTGLMRLADRLVTRPMLGAADRIVFISETTARHYDGTRYRAPPTIIFNGVDVRTYSPVGAKERSAIRESLGWPAKGKVALFVGRFVEKKGLAVIRELARMRGDVQFVLAGWGPIDPDEWRLPNVKVVGGAAGEVLADLYRASDLLLLPSVGEGFPLVVQEALACDLPVLCGLETTKADSAAAPFLTGVAVDLASPAATAALIEEKLDAVIATPRDGRRAAFARDRYSWPAVGTALDSILTEIAAPSPDA